MSESRNRRSSKSSRSKSSSGYQSESNLGGVLRWPLLPFRYVRNMLRHWGPGGAIKAAWGGCVGLARWLCFGPTTAKGHRAIRKESQLEWPSRKAFQNPASWFQWTGSALVRFVTTRSLRSLVLAVPALVFCVSFLSAASWGNKKSADNIEGRYAGRLAQAIKDEDISTARVAADRLVQMHPEEEQQLIRRALVEDELGDPELASNLMQDLAKFDGSSSAAMWLASRSGDRSKISQWPKEQLQEYCDWLMTASMNAPKDPRPLIELSRLLQSYGDLRRAHAVLLPLAQTNVEICYMTVQLESKLGFKAQAKRRAIPLLSALQPMLIQMPQNMLLRFRCSELMILLGQSEEAVSLLRDGMLHAADEQQKAMLDDALVKAILQDLDRETRMDKSAAGSLRKFRLLDEASEIDAEHPLLKQAFPKVCVESYAYNTPDVRAARDAVYAILDTEQIRFIEGTVAIQRGQIDRAKNLLDTEEIVEGDGTQTPGVLNNLAHAILQEKSPDLNRALELCNRAVKAVPGHPYLRETRGQVLVRLGRYRQAASDLELGMYAPELRDGIRPLLVKCYRELDMPEAADLMQRVINGEDISSLLPQNAASPPEPATESK